MKKYLIFLILAVSATIASAADVETKKECEERVKKALVKSAKESTIIRIRTEEEIKNYIEKQCANAFRIKP